MKGEYSRIEAAVHSHQPVDRLNQAFMLNFPGEAARRLAAMPAEEAARILEDQPIHVVSRIFERLGHGLADAILHHLPDNISRELLSSMDFSLSTALLSRLDEDHRSRYLALLDKRAADELRELLEYPENSAGSLMQTRIVALNENLTVGEAIAQIKRQNIQALHHLFLLSDDMRLHEQVDIQRLALADGSQRLSSLSLPITASVEALDTKDDVVEKLKKHRMDALPVVDLDHRLLGVIEGQRLIDAISEDLVTNMQTMVGVSKEERALSSSWFAVKKRLPWLQINLLTGFLAAAVVGIFEGTISKYTALAILLPIAAGQSGNTGAQALAVTMRGLTLREVTIRHWLRICAKEAAAGLVNGLVTAITCGIGVFIWSRSFGLSLIIALAMISSMTIAAVSGAMVPIVLKRLGQDPALSSSIILTTITDIAGFLSFLGIAVLLSGMLEASL